MSKLGISYNIFDGEEILPFALENLRKFADFSVIIYQTTSNFGNENPNLLPKLEKLKKDGLVDMLFEYKPDIQKDDNGEVIWQNGSFNEIKKREIGLNICRDNGCKIYMTLDCDEFYDHVQFKWAIKDFEEGGYDTSFTNLLTYYKLPTMELHPPEKWFQPLFYKIKKGTKFEFFKDYPIFTDRTKMVKAGKMKVYKREEIQQYHYAYVRDNIRVKVENSSSKGEKWMSEAIIYHFENWKMGKCAFLIGMQKYDLKEVENKFDIKI